MKTKLLKKIRKRFEIVYYPRGSVTNFLGKRYENSPSVVLKEGGDIISRYTIGKWTLESATQKAKQEIIDWCRKNYPSKRYLKRTEIKLWHNV